MANWIKKNTNFLIFVVVLFAVRWSIIDHYRVPTGSMIPTISIGDHIIVNKMAYKFKIPYTEIVVKEFKKPKPGDIVVFQYPKNPSIRYVKRLVAGPGDKIEIVDGMIKVNGQSPFDGEMTSQILSQLLNDDPTLAKEVQDKFLQEKGNILYREKMDDKTYFVQRLPLYLRREYKVIEVPEERYFFMGDNRDNSSDSRSWGFVPEEYIVGQAKRVFFSIRFMNEENKFRPSIDIWRFGKNIEQI